MTHTKDELRAMQAQGIDLFNAEYLHSIADFIQGEMDERLRLLAHISDQMRKCFENADTAIRAALEHRHPSEDMEKAVAIERLETLRDELRELLP